MSNQNQEKVAFIVNEWESRYKNPNLLSSDHNINEITGWLNRNKNGEITIQNLIEATQNLGDIDAGGRLQYHKAPQTIIKEVVKAPEETAAQKRQRELVAKSIVGYQRDIKTEFDRVLAKREEAAPTEYISSPDDPTLPFVASSMPPLNSKSDLDHNFPLDVYKFWHHGKHQVAFRKRVNIILQRDAAAKRAAAEAAE